MNVSQLQTSLGQPRVVNGGVYPTTQAPLFIPRYWHSNGNRNTDFSLTTSGDSMTLWFTSYFTDDLIGFIWPAEDKLSHPARRRETVTDYTGVIWTFDTVITGAIAPADMLDRFLTITIKYDDDTEVYIPLADYSDIGTTGTNTAFRTTLNFSELKENVNDAGFVRSTGVRELLIAVITTDFIKDTHARLPAPLEGAITLTNISVVGSVEYANLTVPAHFMGMATSYDDQHNISPERILNEMVALGYTGFHNHYMGMSRYPTKIPNTAFPLALICKNVDGEDRINKPTTEWHKDLASRSKAAGYDVSFSISFEMFSPFAIEAFIQREWDGTPGVTGYTPASYFISLGSDDGMLYLKKVFLEAAKLMNEAGIEPVRLQVGEPWWWWNTTNRKPCFYDFPNKVKYNQWSAAKGHAGGGGYFTPEFTSVDSPATTDNEVQFKIYLEEMLGQGVVGLKTYVNQTYPTAQMSLLFFLPTILSPYAGMMSEINYPQDYYKYPNLDQFVWEAYDQHWGGEISQIPVWAQQIKDEMGYPPEKEEYLAGFVPDPFLAAAFGYTITDMKYKAELTGRILAVSRWLLNDYNLTQQAYWAHTQTVQTGLVIHKDSKFYELEGRKLYPEIDIDRPVRYFEFTG